MNAILLAAEEGAENAFWLPHDINEVIWGSLAFLIVAALLWKFAKKPGADFFRNRREGIAAGLEAAEASRTGAEADLDSIRSALADSDAEAARILEDARQAADALTAEIAVRADRDIEMVRERAQIDLAATRGQVEADLSGELSRLAFGAAERVVDGTLDDANQQRLIDAYITNVGSQN